MTPVPSIETAVQRARDAVQGERWDEAIQVLREARKQPGWAYAPELIEFLVFCLQSQAKADRPNALPVLQEALLLDPGNEATRAQIRDLDPSAKAPETGRRKSYKTTIIVVTIALIVMILTMVRVAGIVNQIQTTLEAGGSMASRQEKPSGPPSPVRFVLLAGVLTTVSTLVLLRLTRKKPDEVPTGE